MLCAASLLAQQPDAVVGSSNSTAVVPPLVSFSGALTDGSGKPISAVVGVTFALYRESQGGAPLWLETQNVYPDKTGHYTVLLGSTTSTGLPPDLFATGEPRWLGVQVQGQAEQPRISLSSVPYSLKAADAQTLGGLPASAFVLAAPIANSSTGATAALSTPQPTATGTAPRLRAQDTSAEDDSYYPANTTTTVTFPAGTWSPSQDLVVTATVAPVTPPPNPATMEPIGGTGSYSIDGTSFPACSSQGMSFNSTTGTA